MSNPDFLKRVVTETIDRPDGSRTVRIRPLYEGVTYYLSEKKYYLPRGQAYAIYVANGGLEHTIIGTHKDGPAHFLGKTIDEL